MSNRHPRVRFRGPRRYEFGIIFSSRMRKGFKKTQRHLRVTKALRKKDAAAIYPTQQRDFKNLTTVFEKANAMTASAFTQKFFKRLTFSSTAQEEIAKALFLSRLQAARLKLSITSPTVTKAPKLAYRAPGITRLALKTVRIVNARKRELGL